MKHNLKTFPEATGDEDWYYMLKWKEDFEAELRGSLDAMCEQCCVDKCPIGFCGAFSMINEILGEKEALK